MPSGLAVERIRHFLGQHADRRQMLGASDPAPREVVVHADTWRRWFDGGKALRSSWSNVAVATLDGLRYANEGGGGDDRRIVDRQALLALSTRAATDRTDENRVALLIATLVWRSGTGDDRSPRYAARALLDERLAPCLSTTAALLADGEFGGAHAQFRVRTIGPSDFTTWFWAVGLAFPASPRPLIFDRRVSESLERLTSRRWETTGDGAAKDYTDYIDAAGQWASGVAQADDLLGLDAERVESLLSDRSPHCLYEWLGEVEPLSSV